MIKVKIEYVSREAEIARLLAYDGLAIVSLLEVHVDPMSNDIQDGVDMLLEDCERRGCPTRGAWFEGIAIEPADTLGIAENALLDWENQREAYEPTEIDQPDLQTSCLIWKKRFSHLIK